MPSVYSVSEKQTSNKKNKSLSIDFVMAFLSIFLILGSACLITALIVYILFLFRELFSTDENSNKLIPIYIFFILIIPLFSFVYSFIGNDPKPQKRNKQNTSYAGLILLLPTALFIPFSATIVSVFGTLLSGLGKIFTYVGNNDDELKELNDKVRCIWLYGLIFLLVSFVMVFIMNILIKSFNKLNIDIISDLLEKINDILLN
jgi:predicted membrane channel-forming protein YqfA (hemolysin III family)